MDFGRRNLLRGRLRRAPAAVRPPGALAEADFLSVCDRCGDCSRACPEGIVARGDGGFPMIDFKAGGCTFCGLCAKACKPGALAAKPSWPLKASFGERCLSAQGVVCRVCGERCEAGAIRFRPMPGGFSRPELTAEACTGCGACVAPCPVAAVTVTPRTEMAACA
ncbi:MAG: ferredoxin-type protein NapF [Alphaproteobacteria bacterium]|nr:ferredoxin-type protein NapF [Alphaproteobacteria bacterium]